MADLLSSLITPTAYNSSQESFHSMSSQQGTHDNTMMTERTPDAHDFALQAAGLDIHDVESYLTTPKNASSLKDSAAKKKKTLSSRIAQQSSASGEPVSLGAKTSHFVSALMMACQAKGLTAVYEIEGDASIADFGGVLKIEDVTITSDGTYNSKKEVKEALAEKGLERVKTMEGKTRKEPTEIGENKNWVGLLHEYHNLTDPNRGPVYDYYSLGPSFACTCTQPSRPDEPFGCKTVPISSKKAAGINSAKEAVEYLIDEGLLNPDGTTKARKKAKLGAAVKLQGRVLEVKKESSYRQKVQDLCPHLGLTALQYFLAPTSALAPNMLSGYASWPNEPGLPKEIGEVRNVFGKKNAREAIAEGVWQVLKNLAEKRGVKVEGVGE